MTHIRPYSPADRAAVEQLNVAYYTTTHGFDGTFTQAVTDALDQIDTAITAGTALGWVVPRNDIAQGSLFLTQDGPKTARLRLFLLHPSLQGAGLGRNLLAQSLQAAPSLGAETLRVSTFTNHTAACTLYARAGFTEVSRVKTHAFGHPLTQVGFILKT